MTRDRKQPKRKDPEALRLKVRKETIKDLDPKNGDRDVRGGGAAKPGMTMTDPCSL